MKTEEIKKVAKEIRELGNDGLNLLITIAYKEAIRREAKKIILRLMDEQK